MSNFIIESQSINYMNNWLSTLQVEGTGTQTLLTYKRSLEHLIIWYQQRYNRPFVVEWVTGGEICAWQKHQQTDKQQAQSVVEGRISSIQRFFQWLISGNLF